uniref:Uncharacterized protein n=1 Tax=Culex pseudovishnui tymo-like virus TaxID=2682816 RepID=A0A6F8PYX5_9VIRU|nr:hypothetical protein [Culex pseudovishnui tymo-like virus]
MASISSAFRSLAARSMDRAFLVSMINFQVKIARSVRAIDDRDRVLFDRFFITTSGIHIGCHWVAVNPAGQQALLLPAQDALTLEYYRRFVAPDDDICVIGNQVLLRRIGNYPASSLIVA